MTPERRRIVVLVTAATVGLAIMLGARPVSAQQILSGYLLALAAIALAPLTRLLRIHEWDPASRFDAALRGRPADPSRPAELIRTEREIMFGLSNAGHVHARLLPILREAAAARLAARHGIALERSPDAARALLGDDAWELLRPDLAPPPDRNAPGLSLRRVRELVETLERL
jgi:hypothetical protein